ncbi:MAG: gephyrin-like molybdotransferase Glp, partial [Solirubrobacterales bacterium]
GRAAGRVLAEPVAAPADVPAFDNSAMDGYAMRAEDGSAANVDAPLELELVAESRAGRPADLPVDRGQAIAISTGAKLPAGADCVVRIEDTEQRERRVLILDAPVPGLNVRRAGEDLSAGEVALAGGTVLGPAELGVIASVGRAQVVCHRRPAVAVLSTGDELRPPGGDLGPGQIHDTNSHSVAALAALAGGLVSPPGWAGDTETEVNDALAPALAADVAIVCGGVSVGAHDHVRPALTALGVEERFWGVALKPGRPTWFGVREGGGLVFGLPGNPVSAIVTFLLFVRPALLALAGHEEDVERTTAVLDDAYPKQPGRAHAVRCRLRLAEDGWHVRPTKAQGSHVLSSMLGADCLAFLPTDAESLKAGSRVEIMLLPKLPLRGKMVDR